MPARAVTSPSPISAVDPNETAACDGEPPYFVAATVGLPGDYSAPDLLQFNSWESAYTSCWIGDLDDAAECSVEEPGPGTALSYYYGLSPLSEVVLGPGERKLESKVHTRRINALHHSRDQRWRWCNRR